MASDARIRRTNRQLGKALVSLILEQGYSDISTQAITERAQVSRATFYRHFTTKEALLLHVLDELIGELNAILAPGNMDKPEDDGLVIFEHVRENGRLYQVLVKGDGTQGILDRLQQQALLEAESRFRAQGLTDGPDVPLRVAANQVVVGTMGLIKWWLAHAEPFPPERMGRIYAQLVIRPALALLTSVPGSGQRFEGQGQER
jgi:AcrR family transcriptional regulator